MKTPGEKRRRKLANQARRGAWLERHVAAQGGLCAICETPFADGEDHRPSLDHVIPLAAGGFNTFGNTQAAHVGCNNHKGNRVYWRLRPSAASLQALQERFA